MLSSAAPSRGAHSRLEDCVTDLSLHPFWQADHGRAERRQQEGPDRVERERTYRRASVASLPDRSPTILYTTLSIKSLGRRDELAATQGCRGRGFEVAT